MVIHPYAKIWNAYVKEQRHLARLKSMWKYNLDIEAKGQVHTEFMNVRDTLYHGDTLCQTKYDYVKGKETETWIQSHVINPINLILRSMVNVLSGSWMYLTHPLMVIGPCAKYGMPMSKLTLNRKYKSNIKTWQKPINLTEVKGQHRIGNMNVRVTSSNGDRPMCQIWLPDVNEKKTYGPDTEHVENPYKFDLEVKFQGRILIMNVRDT